MAILDKIKKRGHGVRSEPEISQAELAAILGVTVAEFTRRFLCPHKSSFCLRPDCEKKLHPMDGWPARLVAGWLASQGLCLIPPARATASERRTIQALGSQAD